jgi:lysozyme
MKKLTTAVCSVLAIIGIVIGSVPNEEIDFNAPSVGRVIINEVDIGELFVSQNALLIIGDSEGCRRTPYKCPAGLDTDGIGNTHGDIGEAKTDEQIAIDWTRNIMDAQRCLMSATDITTMKQGQIDAFTSFIFNTGCTKFKANSNGTSTTIYSLIKAGQYNKACHQLNRWVFGGGKKLPGLVIRRNKETQLCLGQF